MKEIRILLTERSFTNLCKFGYIEESSRYGNITINFTKSNIKELIEGNIVTFNGLSIDPEVVVKVALQDIGTYLINEIIKRSPIYSNMI